MSQTEAERRAQERKRRLLKYFTEPPDPRDLAVARVFLGVAALALLAAGVVARGSYVLALLPLVLAAGAGVIGLNELLRYRTRYRKAYPRPTDQEMDSLLADVLVRVRSVALVKLGITADDLELTGEGWDPVAQLERGGPVLAPGQRQPLVVFGPELDRRTRMEIGRDHVARFSSYRVMAICPTHFNLGLYICTVNLLTGGLGQDQTHEYQYDDVKAIRTITEGEWDRPEVRLRNEDVRFARNLECELQVVTSSGDYPRIRVVVPHPDDARPADLQPSGIEQVVASVRRVLRDRRDAGHAVTT